MVSDIKGWTGTVKQKCVRVLAVLYAYCLYFQGRATVSVCVFQRDEFGGQISLAYQTFSTCDLPRGNETPHRGEAIAVLLSIGIGWVWLF